MAYSTPLMIRQAVAPRDWVTLPVPSTADDPTNTCADMSDEQLMDAIAEADSIIDGYIGRYYAVPATPIPPATGTPHPIDFWSRNIAAYNATLTYSGRQDFPDQDPIARRYAMTMAQLNLVANNGLTLPLLTQPGGGVASSGAGAAYNRYTGDLFSASDFSLSPAGSGGTYLDDNPRPWPWDFSQW